MGLFDLFSSSPEKKIEKAKQVMLNEHHQAQVRQQAIYDLAQFDNELSAQALIERLTVNFRDTIKNEQERGWVRSVLVEQFKERAIDPLKASLQNAAKGSSTYSVSGIIQVLDDLLEHDSLTQLLLETLSALAPSDHRTVELRQQVIDALDDREGDIVQALLPYTVDHSDDIRIKVINLIEEKLRGVEGDHSTIIQALIAAMTDPFASGRTARASANALIRMSANLEPFLEDLEDQLPEDYVLDKGFLKAK